MSVTLDGPMAPMFVISFARRMAESGAELVQIWAGDDLLDVHRARLATITDDYVSEVMGLVGAIESNRSIRYPESG